MKIVHEWKEYGTTKIVTKFLWFPLTLERETRWMERVFIKQKQINYYEYFGMRWLNVKFVSGANS